MTTARRRAADDDSGSAGSEPDDFPFSEDDDDEAAAAAPPPSEKKKRKGASPFADADAYFAQHPEQIDEDGDVEAEVKRKKKRKPVLHAGHTQSRPQGVRRGAREGLGREAPREVQYLVHGAEDPIEFWFNLRAVAPQ